MGRSSGGQSRPNTPDGCRPDGSMGHVRIRYLPIGWAGRLALQRLLSQWRSLLTIIAGVLLSASVGALVPLYTTAVAQVSMVEKFNQLPLETVHANANIS